MAAVSLLAGCGGNTPEPSTEPKNSPPASKPAKTPSQTPTSTGDPTDLPVEKTDNKRAREAEAFVKDFVAELDKAFQTGDTAKFESMYTKGCDVCAKITKRIASLKAQGFHLDGKRHVGVRVDGSMAGKGGQDVMVNFYARTTDGAIVDKSGKEIEKAPGASTHELYFVTEKNGHWVVTGRETIE